MTSSTDPWSGDKAASAVRATRWAPAELHHEVSDSDAAGPAEAAANAHDPIADSLDEAYERGFAEGQRTEGAKLESAIQMLQSAVANLDGVVPAWLDSLDKNVLTLAVAVARQIVGRELATDPEAIQQLVSRALTRFPVEETLTIRLHPSDLSRISAAGLENPGSDPASGRDVRWRADAHIDAGSCVVEGPERMVDGRVDKALLRIYQALVTDE